MLIPKVTHQVWMQGWDQLPQKFHANVEKLRKMNPTWEHKTWDESQLRKACEEYGPECVAKFDSFEHFMQKVDFGRYVILYLYGGVTVDCDMEAIKPLDEIPNIDTAPLIVSKANDSDIETFVSTLGHIKNDSWFINSAFICCEPKNPDMKRLVETCINDRTRREDYFSQSYFILTTTGPIRISLCLKDSNMVILRPEVIESEFETLKSVFVHRHEFSWTEPSSAYMIKLYMAIKEYKHYFILFVLLVVWFLLCFRN